MNYSIKWLPQSLAIKNSMHDFETCLVVRNNFETISFSSPFCVIHMSIEIEQNAID